MRKLFAVLSLPLFVLLIAACRPVQAPSGVTTPEALASTSPEPELVAGLPVVDAVLETRPILDMDAEEAPADARLGDVDDPAIWVHPTDPARSIVARNDYRLWDCPLQGCN